MTAANEAFRAPTEVPVLRGARALSAVVGFVRDPITAATALSARWGDLVGMDLGPPGRSARKPMFLAVGARVNESILTRADDFRAGGVLLRAREGTPLRRLRHGIFSRNDEEHRSLRRAYAKPQSARALKPLAPMLTDLVRAEVAGWPAEGQTDLLARIARLTRLASARFLFGDMPEHRALALCEAIDRLMLLNNRLSTYAFQVPLPGTSYRAVQATAARIEHMIRALVDERIESGKRDNDILSALLDRGEGQPRDALMADIVSQIPTVFAASQETCRATLIWTLVLLAQHPDVYRPLVESLGRPDRPSDLAALRENALLGRVLRESMRLLPSIPFLWRYARRTTEILPGVPVGGGTRVILSQYLTNRHPGRYPEPERFRPERWTTIAPSQFEFMEYSAGARRCIGLHFSETLLPIALSEILKARTIRLADKQRIDYVVAVTLRPRRAVMADLVPPNRAPQRRRIGGSLGRIAAL